MAKAVMTCRNCGKLYEACRKSTTVDSVFRWQNVACSPECGTEYLHKINMSRGITPEAEIVSDEVVEPIVDEVEPLDYKGYDEYFHGEDNAE